MKCLNLIIIFFAVNLWAKYTLEGYVYEGNQKKISGAIIKSSKSNVIVHTNSKGFYQIDLEKNDPNKILCKISDNSTDSIIISINNKKQKYDQTINYDFHFMPSISQNINVDLKEFWNFSNNLPNYKDSSLLKAIIASDYELTTKLVKDGADCDVKTLNHQTALMIACLKGNLNIVKLLIEEGASINKTDWYNQNALFYAAKNGSSDIINLLISKDIDVNQIDDFKENALFYAVRNNNLAAVKILLDNKMETNIINLNSENLLTIAAQTSEDKIFDLLLEEINDLFIIDRLENSALDYLYNKNRTELIGKFLKKAADTKQLDNFLYLAVKFGQTSIVKSILNYKPDLEKKNKNGHTLLMTTLLYKNFDIGEMLIKNGADINCISKTSKPAICYAVNPNFGDNYNEGVLFDDQSEYSKLYYKGSDGDKFSSFADGKKIQSINNQSLIELFLSEKLKLANGKVIDDAIQFGDFNQIKLLLNSKYIPKPENSALTLFIKTHGNKNDSNVLDIVKLFVEKGVIQQKAMEAALGKGNLSIVKFLLDSGLSLKIDPQIKFNPYLSVVNDNQKNTMDVFNFLKDNNAEFATTGYPKLLSYAINKSDSAAIFILNLGYDYNDKIDGDPRPQICFAIMNNRILTAERIIELGANPFENFKDFQQISSPFSYILRDINQGKNKELFRYMLKHKKNREIKIDFKSLTDMVWYDRIALLDTLYQNGINLNVKDSNGVSLLSFAIQKTKYNSAIFLMEKYPEMVDYDVTTSYNVTEYLKKKIFDTKYIDVHMSQALVKAIKLNYIKDKINKQDEYNMTYIGYAVLGLDSKFVDNLLKDGADPTICLFFKKSLVQIAIELRNDEIFQLLKSWYIQNNKQAELQAILDKINKK